MAEYLAPGVYVEETSFRPKSIAGVSTSTAAFVGMTSRGPVTDSKNPPPLLTSFADYEQIYGGFEELVLNDGAAGLEKYRTNHMAYAASAFFNNGGGRLYVARVLGPAASAASFSEGGKAIWKARTPGGSEFATSNANFLVSLEVSQQICTLEKARSLAKQQPGTLICWPPVKDPSKEDLAAAGAGAGAGGAAAATEKFRYLDDKDDKGFAASGMADDALPAEATASVGVLTLVVTVQSPSGHSIDYVGLGFHEKHPRFIATVLGENPVRKSDIFNNPVMFAVTDTDLAKAFAADLIPSLKDVKTRGQIIAQKPYPLTGGSDGTSGPPATSYGTALKLLAGHEDISIIAAPGAITKHVQKDKQLDANVLEHAVAVNNALIAAAEARRAYRIAVMDAPDADMIADVIAHKGNLDSTRAALYYPWITVPNPLYGEDPKSEEEEQLPPSGFVCGVYARTDVNRGVWKPPANEVVFGATRFSRNVHFGEQELLNPLGVNCLRSMPNRGHRIWGARTTSSDPEWMYVNVRRYFLYLEASIDRGTQWAVFEPNGEKLWFNMRETVKDFLYNEWVNGALLGATPKEAFFVRCDRTTMTQNDIDNGRLVCLIGVAAIKPAEFVIFRIGQKLTSSNG